MTNARKRILSLLMALVMVWSLMPGAAAIKSAQSADGAGGSPATVSATAWEAYSNVKESLGQPGMYGFEGDDALPDDASPVSVIALFNHQPAATLQAEAAIEYGTFMSAGIAEVLAEADHVGFQQELDALFGVARGRAASPYMITSEYRLALNGVAITLPANRVADIAAFDSVYAVYPDSTVYLDPVEKVNQETVLLGDKSGNQEGREAMGVDQLHTDGTRGAGATVCIIDTGIDYNHPDFAGAFATSSPSGDPGDLRAGAGSATEYFFGRNFVNDGYVTRAKNDPMETTYAEWKASGQPETDGLNEFYTEHGTHVSGTVAARGTNNSGDDTATSAYGVAPEATIFVYRVFGTYSTSSIATILSAIEYVAIDKPDVVNMSLGSNVNSPYHLYSLAVNNVTIGNKDILFVISSGNAGSGLFTVSTPGTSPAAITVGNATVDKQRVAVTTSVTYVDGSGGGTIIPFSTNAEEAPNEGAALTGEAELSAGEEESSAEPEPEVSNFDGGFIPLPPGGGGTGQPVTLNTEMGIFYMPSEDWYVDYSTDYGVGFAINYAGLPAVNFPADIVDLILASKKITYDVVTLPNTSGIEDSSDAIGTGTRAEFEALIEQYGRAAVREMVIAYLLSEGVPESFLTEEFIQQYVDMYIPNLDALGTSLVQLGKDAIAGKIVIVRRGSNFEETIALAKEFGLGAVILFNRKASIDTTAGLDIFRGYGEDYLPFFVINSYEAGVAFAAACAKAGGKMSFTNIAIVDDLSHMADSSSRGPVGSTYDIKPDVVSHGTDVLSTAPLGEGDTDYSDAYQIMSGTSMASPHVAGAAALLRGAHPDWTAEEIKVRLMNTAAPLQPYAKDAQTTITYGVYEQGAGFVDAYAALHADTTITAAYNNVALANDVFDGDSTITSTTTMGTGSFSFGVVDVDSAEAPVLTPITATIQNHSGSEKNYAVSVAFHIAGQYVVNPISVIMGGKIIDLALSSGPSTASALSGETLSITVPANGEVAFTATMSMPAELGMENAGSYEGHITVSENGTSNTYNLPFAAFATIKAAPLSADKFFPNRAVISSGAAAQNVHSGSMDFYFNPSKGAYLSFFVLDPDKRDAYIPQDDILVNIDDVFDSGALIGDLYYSFDALQKNLGNWYYIPEIIRDGGYYPYTKWDDAGEPTEMSTEKVPFQEGRNTILVRAITAEAEYLYYYFDFYVDNTPAAVTVNGLDKTGDYNSLAFTPGTAVTLTGNVYDDAMDAMDDYGLKFSLYDSLSDPRPSIPDQSYTALYACVDGDYYKATVDPATGDFTVSLPARDAAYDVTLYAVDGYSILMFSEGGDTIRKDTLETDFSPYKPLRFLHNGILYGFVGSNLVSLSLRVEEAGAHMIVRPDDIALYAGETVSIKTLFNGTAKSGGDALSAAAVDNTAVANAVRSGNTITLTSLTEGSTGLALTSQNGLTLTVPVNVNILVGDGVSLKAGDQIYYGAMKHVTDVQTFELAGRFWTIPEWESTESPILWSVMGREHLADGSYADHMTLLSEHVLDVDLFSLQLQAFYVVYDQVREDNGGIANLGSIRNYLNGGQRAILDLNEAEGARYTIEEGFGKNLSAAELGGVPDIKNDVPYYSTEVLLPGLSDVADGDRFFLPWVAPYVGGIQWSVFWSAGEDFFEENALAFRETDLSGLAATFKNGTPYGYWTETHTMDFRAYAVDETGAVNEHGKNVLEYSGVRPGMTLDLSTIVYAKEVEDGVYKLTISGDDALALAGDVTSAAPRQVRRGNGLTVSGSVNSGDYDVVAYKIVRNGAIVGYGELAQSEIAGGTFTFPTSALDNGSYKIYVWPQVNDDLRSNEAGAVSVLNITVSGGATDRNPDGSTVATTPKPETPAGEPLVVTITDLAEGVDEKTQELLRKENATRPIIIEGEGVKIIVPAGTLGENENINDRIVDLSKQSGSVIEVTLPDGTVIILPFAIVGDGGANYLADLPGTYRIIDNISHFDDIGGDYWAASEIGNIAARNLFQGTGDNKFEPDLPVSRAMLATVLSRMDTRRADDGKDAANVGDAWYRDGANWAVENGIMNGTGASFNGDATASREQIVVTLFRFAAYLGMDVSVGEEDGLDGFGDAAGVSTWADSAMKWAVANGILNGKPGEGGALNLDASGDLTRAEFAALVDRFVRYILGM